VRPPSPAYFRLLYMGKMLSDEQTLSGTFVPSAASTETDRVIAIGLDMKIAPATTIIHLSVRTIPPEEGKYLCQCRCVRKLMLFNVESTKKTLLGFSLRPSIRGRNSSANVPSHATNQPSNTTNATQPAPVSSTQSRNAAPVAAPARVATRPEQTTTPAVTQTRSRATGVDDGTHGTGSSGGGCKCVIM
jgi:hypothetical protein